MSSVTETIISSFEQLKSALPHTQHKEPARLTGALGKCEWFDVTPVIGREYPTLDLKQILEAPNSDELLKELAITISQRGVVFFRKQDGLDNDLQDQLTHGLSEQSGKPETFKLHIHPVTNSYEVYDRISPAYQKYLEGLTAACAQPVFNECAVKNGFQLYSAERGAPENIGTDLKAVHPVVRTNPVASWKSVFAVGHHAKRISELTEAESDHLLKWFVQLIVENHDLQVRSKWRSPHDVAVWDN